MITEYVLFRRPFFRNGITYVLAFAWVLGLLSGVFFSRSADIVVTSLMHGAVFTSVSIVSLLLCILLPFLFSAFAVYIAKSWLLLLIGFLKAFLFSFVSRGVLLSFGFAGWLLRLLLIFGDILTLPLLYWYLHRHLQGNISFSAIECFVCMAVVVLIGSIEYAYILPFLADII